MPSSKFPTCAQQPSTTGLGKQFTSPIKRADKRKTTVYIQPMSRRQEISKLKAKIEALKKQAEGIIDPLPPPAPLEDIRVKTPESSASGELFKVDDDLFPGPECVTTAQDNEHLPRRIVPNQAAKDLYTNWMNLLARLTTPLLEYISKSIGKIPERVTELKKGKYFQKLTVEWCSCEELPYILVANGLFPTTPLYPRIAISVHLLDFYRALFERSCDAVNAMASALNTFYTRRGFIVTDKNQVDSAIFRADTQIQASKTMTLITQQSSYIISVLSYYLNPIIVRLSFYYNAISNSNHSTKDYNSARGQIGSWRMCASPPKEMPMLLWR
ncbi:hypothetical protein C0992_003993 [Termitomyces sp. T32_za158]|nr:hypothetical protein C0992_003993 [Termitomyces sp. T32_za158]